MIEMNDIIDYTWSIAGYSFLSRQHTRMKTLREYHTRHRNNGAYKAAINSFLSATVRDTYKYTRRICLLVWVSILVIITWLFTITQSNTVLIVSLLLIVASQLYMRRHIRGRLGDRSEAIDELTHISMLFWLSPLDSFNLRIDEADIKRLGSLLQRSCMRTTSTGLVPDAPWNDVARCVGMYALRFCLLNMFIAVTK